MTESNHFSGQTRAQKAIIDYWRQKRRGALMPSRSEIDPGVLRSHLAAISIVEIDPTGRVRFRLAGSEVRSIFGQEMRGRYLHEFYGPAAEMWSLGLTAALEKEAPVGGIIPRDTDHHAWLRLPLAPRRGSALILCHDMLLTKQSRELDESPASVVQSDRVQVLAA